MRQVAKITDKLAEQLNREAREITGSISAPQTVTPLPVPRPAQRVAAVEAQPPARARVVQDWIIRDVCDGFVYVQGHGDIYQVSIGAPLPGLGPGRTGQAAGRPLDGGDAEGHHRLAARPPLFRVVLSAYSSTSE